MKYIDADLLRKELERLKGQLIRGACAAQISFETSCKDEAYNELLSFLDTLESGSSEIPNDHEKAAAQYARDYTENDEGNGGDDWEDDIRITFIAGAKWQKEQMLKGAVPFYEILKAVPPGPERDKVRIIIVKEDEK